MIERKHGTSGNIAFSLKLIMTLVIVIGIPLTAAAVASFYADKRRANTSPSNEYSENVCAKYFLHKRMGNATVDSSGNKYTVTKVFGPVFTGKTVLCALEAKVSNSNPNDVETFSFIHEVFSLVEGESKSYVPESLSEDEDEKLNSILPKPEIAQ